MTAPATTVYDEVLYPNRAFPQSHPERLATIATLLGMEPTPPTQCRVLEIGCGQGWNLFPMAYDLPESLFVGLDYAARPIAIGQENVATLGLDNVQLLKQDILDDSADLGTFDYIIAHGVYSWTPAAVRDRVLALCHEHLSPQGVAFISYITYPGGYLTRMNREMMRFHMQHFEGTRNQVRQGRAMLKLLVEAQTKNTPYRNLLEHAYERIRMAPDEYLCHDDLGEVYSPCYFHQFMHHAQEHGLHYLAEAVFAETFSHSFPDQVEAALQSLANNVLLKQQYLDFMHGRTFRQSLLCHQDVALAPEVDASSIRSMYVAAPAREVDVRPNKTGIVTKYEGLRGTFVESDQPEMHDALLAIGAQWPAFVAVGDLITETSADPNAFGKAILRLYQSNFLEVYLDPPHLVTSASERPIASPIARFQIQTTPYVSTQSYGAIQMGDPISRIVLPLLDGTRARSDLLDILIALVRNGTLSFKMDDQPTTDRAQAVQELPAILDRTLADLAWNALLIA